MEVKNGLYHFSGTWDFMQNYKFNMGGSIFIGRYWYYTLCEEDFLDYMRMSKEEVESRLYELSNGWSRADFEPLICAAPHFLFKNPDGYIFGIVCLTI